MGIKDCNLGINVKIVGPVNLYECTIGNDCFIGPFVEIQRNVIIGDNTRIQSHSFICEGVTIENHCFIGHGVMFINDKYDSPTIESWIKRETSIGNNVRIGSNATILPIEIGNNSIIGAGSVVTKNIPENTIFAGNPAKFIRGVDETV